ncbi:MULTISPECIES: isoleucine--tRNA ligase [Petrimonas]|jgi:isoleucyl-tRNA synthetase|uniref:Isoleucine--tRNA ligase n=1 Tax=Petrimonas mucosa TaxID=1642646 RepID=A0A1G4GBC3_9BACT|nr:MULTISPECIES: isoleucine--tRNA ligase [Petrimonas]MDD3561119.1 isoleucine--tRNA ligase [Petrimonas mucosa]SCM59818.1 Isoleucine-tRNA ligase {ECO:0000255/HAMAP-Rule:MF_02003} [Petrimonas mucosa]HHT28790.1 isoleucine--tRNA ligase [Petrimonas mucosa]
MSKKFTEYSQLNLSEINKEMLRQWDEQDLFHKSLEIRKGHPAFVFYEGPPSANGMPGIHHVIARSIKDIFCRYKTMKGFLVNRKAGWDTHGLPVELGVEKSLGITKEDIGKTISVEEYNNACRTEVMKYTREWEELTRKMGYWVDMNDPYITYDNRYIETLWYLLKEIYNKGYLYKGYTIQPYSPAAGTGLSTHELNQPGCYRDVKDTTCTAQFKITNPLPEWTQFGEPFFLAWTTTPWTLPSNMLLAVGPNIEYVAVQTYNQYTGKPLTVVLAKNLLGSYFPAKNAELKLEEYKEGDKNIPFRVLEKSWRGSELAGIGYEQLFPWVKVTDKAFRVVCGDFVTTDDGTGIVHIAPTFGADDARVGKENDVPGLTMVDKEGNIRPMVDLTGKYFLLEELDADFVKNHLNVELYREYAGRYVKNEYDASLTADDTTLDVDLSVALKLRNRAFRIEKMVHSYPHCWRTDKPVLYYPLDSWFIRSTACREKMIELNETINWKPQSTGTGRFGKWLENLQDWNLSRSRYWGTPLPIWRTEDGKEEKCIGSVKELCNEMQKALDAGVMTELPWKGFDLKEYRDLEYDKIDLHRPYVDKIVLVSESGRPMYRETDLIDVWFDSGAMPFAQFFYPHIPEEEFAKVYPADFIAEGVDQTRGWFFTLHAISTMVKGSVAFKNVISNGLVLDKNGNKMSKRLGNAVDPFETIEKFGSDPLRWYMVTNAAPWDNLKFDIDGVEEARRKFFGTLFNTYSFFALYANVDNFHNQYPQVELARRPEIDRWILSLLNSLVKEVDENYANYEPTKAGRAINDFVNDNLSNWYVRLNRKRFWGGEMTEEKMSAYQTLYHCLVTVAKLMAPIAPFYADRLYLDLVTATGSEDAGSVHLADFPVVDEAAIDTTLEEQMYLAQTASSIVLALRRKVNLKVRQPLMKIMIPVADDEQRKNIEAVKALILSEVNVKELEFVDSANGMLVKRVKPDFKKLGPKYGKIMKPLAASIQGMSQEEINELEKRGRFAFRIEDQEAVIELADVEIISEDIPGWLVANEGRLTVALDITVTDELRKEGIARELVNRIQNLRKSKDFDITDRIAVRVSSNPSFDRAITDFGDYIRAQVLADSIEIVAQPLEDEIEIDDEKLTIEVRKQ